MLKRMAIRLSLSTSTLPRLGAIVPDIPSAQIPYPMSIPSLKYTCKGVSMGLKKGYGVSLDSGTVERIDSARGEIPRSRVLERLINRGLEAEQSNGRNDQGSA